jgi:hypothetical protein
MLIYSMGVSVDGFMADREGGYEWTPPSEEEAEIHVHHARFLRIQRMNRYDFSVQIAGPHFEEVGTAFGREEVPIGAGHTYLVRFSSTVSYLLVEEVVATIS